MPAFYAHYKFGQMVKNKLPAKYQRLLEDYQDLYEIGLHGPDILFFYHPIIRHPITQIGVVIHHETGRVFFEHALTQMHRSAAEGDKMQKALWAYALGVVCHFALDASCHTYINHFEKTRRMPIMLFAFCLPLLPSDASGSAHVQKTRAPSHDE